jgi:hypothetical protein
MQFQRAQRFLEDDLQYRAWGHCQQDAGHQKSNMAAEKPEIGKTQALYEIETKFKRIRKFGPEETRMRPLEFHSYVTFTPG